MIEKEIIRSRCNGLKLFLYKKKKKDSFYLGMATGRIWAGFFNTWIQLAGLSPRPGPSPFTKRIFFPGLGPAPSSPRAHLGQADLGPIRGPTQKKKEKKEN